MLAMYARHSHMDKLWGNKFVPVQDRKGQVNVEFSTLWLEQCCGDSDGAMLLHDFEVDPERVWECLHCASCGGEIKSHDVTRLYDMYDLDKTEELAEARLKGN